MSIASKGIITKGIAGMFSSLPLRLDTYLWAEEAARFTISTKPMPEQKRGND